MYRNNDTIGDSYIYRDSNSFLNMEYVFEQVGEVYKVKYKVDNQMYPSNYISIDFEPTTDIELFVYSESIIDSGDLSGVNLTLINNTDLILKVKISGALSRINIVSQTGSVVLNLT